MITVWEVLPWHARLEYSSGSDDDKMSVSDLNAIVNSNSAVWYLCLF